MVCAGRKAQLLDIFIPVAVFHTMLAVLNAPLVAEQPEQLSGTTLPGTQAGQQIPALSGHFPGGYIHFLAINNVCQTRGLETPFARAGTQTLAQALAAASEALGVLAPTFARSHKFG